MRKRDKIAILLFRGKRKKFEKKETERTGLETGNITSESGTGIIYDCAVKAAMVFLVCFGIILCFADAFNVEFDMPTVGGVIFLTAFILAVFKGMGRGLSFILYIGVLCGAGWYIYKIRNIIKEITLMLMNHIYPIVQEKFLFPDVDGFPEIITDKSYAFTLLFLIVGIALTALFTLLITDSMSIIMNVIVSLICMQPWLFMEITVNTGYIAMIVCSWIMVMIFKFNYKNRLSGRKREFKSYRLGDKVYYVNGSKGNAAFIILAFICAVCFCTTEGIKGDSELMAGNGYIDYTKSPYKEIADTYAKNIMVASFSKYKNYVMNLRVSGGQLGNYSSIHLTGETFLKARIMPYSKERFYVKSYIGSQYSSNEWSIPENYNPDMTDNAGNEYMMLKDSYENSEDMAVIKGKIDIKNIKAPSDYGFVPYYADIDKATQIEYQREDLIKGSFEKDKFEGVEYYHKIDDEKDISCDDSIYREYVYENYLGVPQGLKEKILKFCEENGFDKNDEALEEKLREYFDQNYVYTINPGIVPWKTDFTDYFLFQNKKGFCVHFATAGALIYRSLGIPARYVEGYAIDYSELAEGTEVQTENKRDWLSLYNDDIAEKREKLLSYSNEEIDMMKARGMISEDELKLRDEEPYDDLKLMEVDIKDRAAHAWVEIYKDGFGWVTVDLTPPDYKADTNEQESIMESVFLPIEKIADVNESINRNINLAREHEFTIDDGYIKWGIGIICVILLIFGVKSRLIWFIRLNRPNKIKRLAEEYEFTKKHLVFLKRIKENSGYADTEEAMREYGERGVLRRIMEKAAFSKAGISEEERRRGIKAARKIRREIIKNAKITDRIKIFIKV